jgi:ketosteroid isomerase-like protein
MSDDSEILEANERFYDAFTRGDVEAMEELWARDAPVACIHPGWGLLGDRQAVMDSWARILASDARPEVRCAHPIAWPRGDTAIVLCTEVLADGELVATNIFVREDEAWKICHHQAGPVAMGRAPRGGPVVVN